MNAAVKRKADRKAKSLNEFCVFLRNYLNEESQKSHISDPFPIQPTKKHRLIEKGQELYSNKPFVEDLEKSNLL